MMKLSDALTKTLRNSGSSQSLGWTSSKSGGRKLSDYPVQGQIEEAKRSQSGKTVGVKIGGKWYSSKDFKLESMVGSVISGFGSDSDFNGKTMHWLNAYTVDAAPASNSAPNGNGGNVNYQPMVSNLAAHLIAAGKQPHELSAWFKACKAVLNGQELSDAVPYNDGVPF